MRKIIFFIVVLISFCIIVHAIEVGGHLTEDTTWSPENNPYLVTSGVYVDVGVTLTILPGTIVKFNSDYYDDMGDDQFYFHNGEEPIAKFMRVEGRIIAEGTEQDSIIFTRMQDEQYYHWGTIYLPEGSQQSSFKHCLFEFAAFTGFSLSEQPHGAISMWNGSAIIENCSFIDNHNAIYIRNCVIGILITNNYFDFCEYLHPNINSSGYNFIAALYIINVNIETPLIAGNIFMHGTAIFSSESIYFTDNNIVSLVDNQKGISLSADQGISYFYDNNIFGSYGTGIYSNSLDQNSLYIKNNYFNIVGGEGVYIDDAYVEISDNYFEGCDLDTGLDSSGKVYNNILSNAKLRASSYLEVFNNVCFGGDTGIIVTYRNESNTSNLSINNQYAFGGYFNGYFNNCIILDNEELTQYGISGNPIFRNCILDFELEYPLIDGGGNIIVDSMQAQSIFEDIQNGDFHLIEGSLAIDAGFDTLGYYYPFDIDYNHRVWDGDGNGSAIIDIGPYEFGAPAFGGIEGYTYNPTTGDSVDYVLLIINNQPGEFTFSDSLGNFEYKLPAGIYDIYAERVFYEDVVEYQVEVIDGEFTQIAIPMYEMVDIEESTIIPAANDFNLTNYPNPFNPTTIIHFELPFNIINPIIEIFNIKGQKIKQFSDISNKSSVIWDGNNNYQNPVSSGIYFYKIKAGNRESVNRMLLLK